ncbi:MAG: hypothetical protein M3461_07930 [Pseudomonadota bacterium]|nr:hypothetical protein [Pseudomonadota bacterium]
MLHEIDLVGDYNAFGKRRRLAVVKIVAEGKARSVACSSEVEISQSQQAGAPPLWGFASLQGHPQNGASRVKAVSGV